MTTPALLDSPQAIEEHLRRHISAHDLDEAGVRFVMCDVDNRVLVHAQIGGDRRGELDPMDGERHGPDATITTFLTEMAQHGLLDGVLVALTRPGRPSVTEDDRACYRAARAICSRHGVRLLGMHVVTPRGLREVVLDDAL